MYLALGLGMVVVYLCVTLEANRLVLALAAIYLALVLRRLIMNPAHGFRLGDDRIDWFKGRRGGSAALDELDGVSIGRSAEGVTVCVVRLLDGRTAALPGVEEMDPRDLMREFGRRGIRISA